jgi:N-acetylglucosaminyl-diphospho-decaprenol L-rhamnosyltransferase
LIYVSVVSHGHDALIMQLDCLSELTRHSNITVILKNNCSITNDRIAQFCQTHQITFIDKEYGLGFGDNNNYIFSYAVNHLNLTVDDYFLVLNPDVYVSTNDVLNLVNEMQNYGSQLSTLNLFKDNEFIDYDYCVRTFPSLFDFIGSYIGLGNKSIIDKSNVNQPVETDWAAGSFLLFKASLYKKLNGFDSNYFMYCEDIDICWRSRKLFQEKLTFFPHIKAIHHAQHANRSILSKHFFWHLKSMMRYLTMYYGLRKPLEKKENKICTKE